MATAILDEARPPMWGIERVGREAEREFLRFGRHRIALADIASVSGDEEKTRPIDGLLIGATIFMCVATILAFSVFEGGWRMRFLLGAGFLAFLGLIGLSELFKIKSQSLFRLRIMLRNGETVTFASTDRDDVHRLMARISPQS